MRIRHFHFVGIRKLDGLVADLPRKHDTDLVVAHGGRGSGKTTFLDALAAAKERISETGAFEGRWDALPGPGAESAKVAIDWELSEEERNRMALSDSLREVRRVPGRACVPEQALASAFDEERALRFLAVARPDVGRHRPNL